MAATTRWSAHKAAHQEQLELAKQSMAKADADAAAAALYLKEVLKGKAASPSSPEATPIVINGQVVSTNAI